VGGVEQYRLEGTGLGHSFLVPRLSLQELYNSNTGYASTTGASQGDAVSAITGGLVLQLLKRNSELSLDYSSTGLIYAMQTQPNSTIQLLGITQKYNLRHWNLLFAENLSYLPNSQFGLGGLGYLGLGTAGAGPGPGGNAAFNPNFQSGPTVGSTNVNQLSSTTAAQAQYTWSPRSSLSVSGSVGFLQYFGADSLDSRDVIARVGYDRSLSARDTLNFSYTASILTYPSGVQGFYAQYVQAGYRRILTGRLHLSVSSGPVITHFSPQNGQTTVPGGQNVVNWSALASLEYLLRSGGISAQYSRSVSGGSGLLIGATTDQLSGNFSHRFGRVWNASFNGSYARNNSFEQTGPANSGTSTFNYWTAGCSVSRSLGHYSTLRFFYSAQSQTANTTVCANGVACGPIALVQVAGLALSWSTRPYKLD